MAAAGGASDAASFLELWASSETMQGRLDLGLGEAQGAGGGLQERLLHKCTRPNRRGAL